MEILLLSAISWYWLAAAIMFAVIEGLTAGLTTIWCAISAVIMIFISIMPISLPVQLFLFAVIALLLLIFTRPFLYKKLHITQERTNADSLLGKKVLVHRAITQWEKGEVKINGIIWSAASKESGGIPENTECIIEKIEGATLIIRKV